MLPNLLSRLNPQFVRAAAVALGLGAFGWLLYYVPSCQRQQQAVERAKDASAQEASEKAGQSAHTQYLIDSTALATERRVIQQRQGERVDLPEHPPKEL